MLDIRFCLNEGIGVFEIHGNLDYETSVEVREVLRRAIHEATLQGLVLDMENVGHVDSSGLGLMIATRNTCENLQTPLALCSLQGKVFKIFKQTNLNSYFKIFDSRVSALKGVGYPG